MTDIFDGKSLAEEKLMQLKPQVDELKKREITPKLVSILIGDDPASILYLNLKKKAAERIGIKVDIVKLEKAIKLTEITRLIASLNKDKSVHGIMIQLPLPDDLKNITDEIISLIDAGKDVDGLSEKSMFLTPVVKAIVEVVRNASVYLPKDREARIVVVGASGFEGKKIFKIFSEMGYKLEGVDSSTKDMKSITINADILISSTGSEGVITKEMVKNEVILIDVGSPKGDIDKEAYDKASYVSPVPGGIGPVTISCLMENLVQAASN